MSFICAEFWPASWYAGRVPGMVLVMVFGMCLPGQTDETSTRESQGGEKVSPLVMPLQTNSPGALTLLQEHVGTLTAQQRTNLSQRIAIGANLEEKDADQRTALTHAVLRGDLDTVRMLVEAGANVKARDSFHKTPLLYAVDSGRRDIVNFLASNGDLQSPTPRERKERQRR